MEKEDSFDAGNSTVVSIPRSDLDIGLQEEAVADSVESKHPDQKNLKQQEQQGGEVGEETNNILDSQFYKSQTTTTTTASALAAAAAAAAATTTTTTTTTTTGTTTGTTHSPSISSISSLDSDSSTGKLIKSFSKTKLTDNNKENQQPPTTDTKPIDLDRPALMATSTENSFNTTTKVTKLPQSVASKTNFYNDLTSKNTTQQQPQPQKKKPIKFTVRKVSHEAISTPSSPSPDAMTHGYSHSRQSSNGSYHHHNQHKSPIPTPVNGTFTSTKLHHTLQPSQSPPIGMVASPPSLDSHELETRKKLNAAQHKYDQYEARIGKIDKEIQFLTNLLPPYNVDVDYTTRVKIQRAIEKLRGKQDELARKKYGLGITISRLWRASEGSEIWVRKVD
ncbi:hypothetical protein CORT_0C00720 [Candida orthopsilosis Co 90-125]|uniref:Uncharacterized protein n=1 Tax=Candida orthopsilosis (strain 90-125) TaxID=1136231 RepID=H8X3H7_CANO9|nr:hypothetical protein CORT_0C00720 [Candida orthopsilosis Co 90-125]CCG25450.1 hypothetical protein CORT_0C00720 [Candida orthopsilosis Co 90-125]